MRRVIDVISRDEWVPAEARGTVTLDFENRFRRRVRLQDDAGDPFMLDLSHATRFEDGDGLKLEDGSVLLVCAALQDVLEVAGQDTSHMARLAWHIGNRHTPVEVLANGTLRIEYDHVLAHMLEGLGARVSRAVAKFSPESGAYDNSGDVSGSQTEWTGHGHSHSHH